MKSTQNNAENHCLNIHSLKKMKRKIYTVTHESINSCYDIDKSFSSKKNAEDFVEKAGCGYIQEYILERTIPKQLKFSVIITYKMEYEIHYNNTDVAPNTIRFIGTKSLCDAPPRLKTWWLRRIFHRMGSSGAFPSAVCRPNN